MSDSRRKFVANVALSLVLATSIAVVPMAASASDATQQLQSAVHRLTARLNSGDDASDKAEGWRRYLLLNVLETQAAKGEQADLATLQQLLHRFTTNAMGLDHPAFVDVRVALEKQIENLNSANVSDLRFATELARSQFRPITIDTMAHYRNQAKRELESLKIFYRQSLPSYERADAFYTLQLDETLEFLSQIEFELPPEISVGKMSSMIRDVQKQLDEVIEKIDALPFRPVTPQQENDNGLDLEGPAPDDDSDLTDLKTQRKSLETRVAELRKQRDAIRREDFPRQRTRVSNIRKLLEFEAGFATTADNFGDPYFTSSRLAFERFVRAYLYGTEDNLQEDYLLRIERLSIELPKLVDPSDRVAFGVVGNTLDWLENAFQAPQLVTAIRTQNSLPNAYVSISGNLLNQLGGQNASQSRPIYENIKGRLVRGQATNNSIVSFDLIDDPNQVHVSIRANADIQSNTYLQQGKIYAYVDASGQGEARRSLLMNIGGLLASEPYAAANMSTFFQGTSSNCNLVNRIASQKFAESKAESDVGASARVRDELLERFSAETMTPIENGKSALSKAQKKSRNRANMIPELYAHSQANRIVVVGKKSSKATLAAPNFPMQFGVNSDVEAQLHDSLLTNYLDPIFSGKTFSNQELAKELEKLTGKKAEALEPDPANGVGGKDESFSITFTNVRPIQFVFEDNTLAVVVSGKSFSQGEKKIDAGLRISVRFRITIENGALKLVRVGKAELDYVDSENKDAKIVGFRSFLDGRLNPPGEKPQVIDLPANLLPIDKIEALKDRPAAQAMRLSQCRIEGGWFYLGWNYSPANSMTSRPIDLPAIWNEATIGQMDSTYTPIQK